MSTDSLTTAEDTTAVGDDVTTPEPETVCGALYQMVTSGVVVGGLCVFGIIANGLTLGVLPRYARKSKGSSPTALMLAALAVTDSCLLLLLLILQSTPVYCNNVGTHTIKYSFLCIASKLKVPRNFYGKNKQFSWLVNSFQPALTLAVLHWQKSLPDIGGTTIQDVGSLAPM